MRKKSKHTALLPHRAKQEKTNALSLAAPKEELQEEIAELKAEQKKQNR